MRIATISQRLCLVTDSGAIDVHAASAGRFAADPAAVYPRWREFADWAAAASLPDPQPYAPEALGSPSPAPRQVYGIGLNYCDHVAESGFARPETAAAGLHQVPVLHHRAVRARSPCRPAVTPTGKSSWPSSSARPRISVPAATAWELRGRPVGGPGHLRADPADGHEAAAVQPGQVLPGFRPGRPLAGDTGRVQQSRGPGTRLSHQRRADAARPDVTADLLGAPS